MRHIRLVLVATALCALMAQSSSAQAPGLGASLLERYFGALRQEMGIPGLSAAVVENGRIAWERGFGSADIAANIPARPDTPYPITGLTQSIGAILTLNHCVESGRGALTDRVIRWTPFAEPATTIQQLLLHVLPTGQYQYDPARFAVLSEVAGECARGEFDQLVANEIFERLAMIDSVPARDVLNPAFSAAFTDTQLARYGTVLRRLAVPYRLDARRAPVRAEHPPERLSAFSGAVSTVRDLARLDAAIDDDVLLLPETREMAWSSAPGRPAGMGWFVQVVGGQRVVWQFGGTPDGYSSLIVKIPARRLTLILLANSDGLTSTLNPQAPDVTQSLFARAFLGLSIN